MSHDNAMRTDAMRQDLQNRMEYYAWALIPNENDSDDRERAALAAGCLRDLVVEFVLKLGNSKIPTHEQMSDLIDNKLETLCDVYSGFGVSDSAVRGILIDRISEQIDVDSDKLYYIWKDWQ